MAALSNSRHERFAQELAKGKCAVEAYKEAGYGGKWAEKNAHRLTENDGIKDRVRQLQERSAQRTDITLEKITQNLMEDRAKALESGQIAAAVQADRVAAKLHGLEIERIEATHHTITDKPMTVEDWTNQHAQDERTH